jgi:Family of unknown function (DUF6088)
MSNLTKSILSSAHGLAEGQVLSPREFLHLSSRAAVDQAFTRLVLEGKLMRVGRGMYVAPIAGRFGLRPPASGKVVQALAHKTGQAIVPHGAAAANALGLSSQVPINEVFVTSGRSFSLQFGARVVQINHVPSWQLALGASSAGDAVRALSWMGPEQADEAIIKIKKTLPETQWAEITAMRSQLPTWMAKALGQAM